MPVRDAILYRLGAPNYGYRRLNHMSLTTLKRAAAIATATLTLAGFAATSAHAASQAKSIGTPYGTLTSNAWRTSGNGSISGNTRQWTYQVSAVVGGTQTVEQIRTTWTAGASLRNSASLSLTVGSSVGASASSSWQSVTQTKYWYNTNGARSASYRSNMVVAPQQDYRSNTVWIQNTAYVKFRGDARNWQIIASA